jgi:hypothetical protein
MTDEMTNDEAEPEAPDVQITLADPDQVAYDALVEEFGDELVTGDLEEVVKGRVRELYDNQDEIRQRIMQAQQQATPQ